MSSRGFSRLLLVTAIATAVPWSAAADPADRVARISFTAGSVSFRPSQIDQWSVATVNYPLTVGDHLWTDAGARSELQLGTAVVRVAPLTELSVLTLDDRTAQLRVTEGVLSVRVGAMDSDDVIEIDTPSGAVSLLEPGLYRVDVNEAGDTTTVTVRDGEADIAAGADDTPLSRGQSATLAGLDNPRASVQAAVRIDEFEDWCLTRDRRRQTAASAQYVSPATIGYDDLDANGSWTTVAEYGAVWIPRVRSGWAPYRFGRWAWVEPWGWTWIDDAPWGFAPFHYGRWAFLPARGWVWVPGTIVRRPVYAPALVAFVGGSGWAVSGGIGEPIGWFPLGPREVYVPSYRVTPVYVQRLNAPHVRNVVVANINVTNITYVNRGVPGAVTVVSRDTFVRSQPVARATVAVPRERIATATVVGMSASVSPQRASIVGEAVPRATPPAVVVSRQVVVRRPPPEAPREPLVRAVVVPRNAPARQAPAPTRTGPATQNPTPPPQNPTAVPRNPTPPPTNPTPPPTNPTPAPGAVPRPSRATAAELASQQAQERADIQARHAQERAALQAQHQREQQAAAPPQRAEIAARHREQMQSLQEKQKHEREAMQQRHQAERKQRN